MDQAGFALKKKGGGGSFYLKFTFTCKQTKNSHTLSFKYQIFKLPTEDRTDYLNKV